MFGSHLSVAGGMELAVAEAVRLSMDCVQVFTKNQQQWKAPPLKAEAITAWKSAIKAAGWAGGVGVSPRVTSHASYLINMAAPDKTLRDKSIALMREEVERCEALDIPLLVFHPGAFTSGTREGGVAMIADACASIIKETRGYSTVLCLENVVGAGSTIGREISELADLRARIITATGQPQRVGFCIDTCHAHAAGYDCGTFAAAKQTIAEFVGGLGDAIRCLHVNDSKVPMGSRKDRHEHIGEGTIGLDGFRAWVNEPAFANIPKIMETPKGITTPKGKQPGEDFDAINLARLRAMIGTTTLPTLTPINAPSKPAAKLEVKTPKKVARKPSKPAKTKK